MATQDLHERDELVRQLRDLAARLGTDSISRSTWTRETDISEWQVLKHFDSWNRFVSEAGLVPEDRFLRIDDADLFRALQEAFESAGQITTRSQLRKFCRYSSETYFKRWGRWPNVLARFREWAEEHAPGFPYLNDLPTDPVPATGGGDSTSDSRRSPQWTSRDQTQYGPFLNFRGLQHAPINEQGVVFLFGIVAFDLGYVVEGVGTGYPDCEAKRSVSGRGDLWERIRIEFEFRSRNFLTHGHNPAGCDLIVCWEDNWPGCPLEVLELKTAIDGLVE